jgi:hypothetical protein
VIPLVRQMVAAGPPAEPAPRQLMSLEENRR